MWKKSVRGQWYCGPLPFPSLPAPSLSFSGRFYAALHRSLLCTSRWHCAHSQQWEWTLEVCMKSMRPCFLLLRPKVLMTLLTLFFSLSLNPWHVHQESSSCHSISYTYHSSSVLPTYIDREYDLFLFSHQLMSDSFVTPWTIAHQVLLLMGFPCKNTGVSRHFLLQEIFLTWGLNPCLLNWQADSLPLSNLGSPSLT